MSSNSFVLFIWTSVSASSLLKSSTLLLLMLPSKSAWDPLNPLLIPTPSLLESLFTAFSNGGVESPVITCTTSCELLFATAISSPSSITDFNFAEKLSSFPLSIWSDCLSLDLTVEEFLAGDRLTLRTENGSLVRFDCKMCLFNKHIEAKGLFGGVGEAKVWTKLSTTCPFFMGVLLLSPSNIVFISDNESLCLSQFPPEDLNSFRWISCNSGRHNLSRSIGLICKRSCKKVSAPSPSKSWQLPDSNSSKISSTLFSAWVTETVQSATIAVRRHKSNNRIERRVSICREREREKL